MIMNKNKVLVQRTNEPWRDDFKVFNNCSPGRDYVKNLNMSVCILVNDEEYVIRWLLNNGMASPKI